MWVKFINNAGGRGRYQWRATEVGATVAGDDSRAVADFGKSKQLIRHGIHFNPVLSTLISFTAVFK